jgi:Leucine-rich repeat (LRR) protein
MQNEMKKFILLLIIVSFHYCHVKAQWVTIPDANFAARLQQLYPSCMNGNQMDTTCGGIFTSILLVSNQNIADLTGLEYFHFLQILHCENNQLTFLPQLPAGLQELHCYNNQLTYLPELPASLIELHCNDNQLTSLPFLPEFLQEASFQNNQIACLPNIPMMPLYFDYSNNPITCFP